MLESHVQHIPDQFTYVEGQITALSSQIEDMMMGNKRDLTQNLSSSSSIGHFGQKGGESFEGEMHSLRGSIA